MSLSDVAILTAQEMPTHWVHMGNLIGWEGLWYPIYACGNCYQQRYTLKSRDLGKLPATCPQCNTPKSVAPGQQLLGNTWG